MAHDQTQLTEITVDEAQRRLAMRDQICQLEAALRQREGLVELPPCHHFAQGLYARELRIPRGALLVGKIHKTEHINILAEGEITVLTEEGVRRLIAPQVLVGLPGTKRVGYAHTDVTWVTVHATEERDLAKLEAELIAVDYTDTGLDPMIEEVQRCLGLR